MTSNPETDSNSPADRRSALGAAYPLTDDSPRWHLTFAEESIDTHRWGDARAALARGRDNIAADSADADEAAFVAVRLAMAEVNLQAATAEVMALVERMDPLDPVWSRRVRRIISEAPSVAPQSMRTELLAYLPPVPAELGVPAPRGQVEEIERIPVPVGGLPDLADDLWIPGDDDSAGATAPSEPPVTGPLAIPPVPTKSPFLQVPMAEGGPAGRDDVEEVVVFDAGPEVGEPLAFTGRILVGEEGGDLTDADALRERLVEQMLAKVTEEEGQLLFDTATTFLNNGEPATAELMFSAAMQIPRLRIPACEGMIQALVAAERYVEAAAHGVKAGRLFASQGDLLTGIVYWHGVAAQALGDTDTARTCFARVGDGPHAMHFPDLGSRLAALAR
jgi:hypothetical protein